MQSEISCFNDSIGNLSRNNYYVHTNLIGTQINYEENKEIIMGIIKDKSRGSSYKQISRRLAKYAMIRKDSHVISNV
jgi:hypothetical protein